MTNCPHCGKLTDPQLENCPHCGGRVALDVPRKRPRRASHQTCPSCQALVQEGDIICVACGTNLLTGHKVSDEIAPRRIPSNNANWMIGGGIAAALVLVIGLFVVVASDRDPLSQALRLIEAGDYSRALTELEVYVDKVSDDEQAFYQLGRLQLLDNNPGRAARSFERAYEIGDSDGRAVRAAIGFFEQGGGGNARARQLALLERLVRNEPRDAEAWYMVGLARGSMGDLQGQAQAFEELARLRPSDAAAQWALGLGLALEHNLKDARQKLSFAARVREADSDLTPAQLAASQGFLASASGDSERAIDFLTEAVEDPSLSVRAEALTQLGKLLTASGRFDAASAFLEEAKSLRPNDDGIRYLRAVCLQARGSIQLAAGEFDELSRPGGKYAMDAAIQLAVIRLDMKDPPRAREAADRAGSLGATGAAYYTVRGRIEAESDDLSRARENFNRAIDADSGYAPAYLENGLVYIRQESLTAGLEQLERYLNLLGPETERTQAAQVQALAEQLRQTTGQSAGAPARVRSFLPDFENLLVPRSADLFGAAARRERRAAQ